MSLGCQCSNRTETEVERKGNQGQTDDSLRRSLDEVSAVEAAAATPATTAVESRV